MMAEWHITPDYIVNNWTDELLNLMVDKMVERKKREQPAENQPIDRVSELAIQSRGLIKVVKN